MSDDSAAAYWFWKDRNPDDDDREMTFAEGFELGFHSRDPEVKRMAEDLHIQELINKSRWSTDPRDFKKGVRVRFMPRHVMFDIDHPDCQTGVIKRLCDNDSAFVIYDNLDMKMVTGDEDYTAAKTDLSMLMILEENENV